MITPSRLVSIFVPLLFAVIIPRYATIQALLFGQPPRRHLNFYSTTGRDRLIFNPIADDDNNNNGPQGTTSSGRSHNGNQFHHNHRATKEDDMRTTWSKKANERQESRLGVRRRVRAVLAKARERTGVSNDSEKTALGSSNSRINKRSASLLGSDSNLGLEATTRTAMTWSFRNGDSSDFLDADATLSLLMAHNDDVSSSVTTTTATTSTEFSTVSYTSPLSNGKSASYNNGATRITTTSNPSYETLRGGQSSLTPLYSSLSSAEAGGRDSIADPTSTSPTSPSNTSATSPSPTTSSQTTDTSSTRASTLSSSKAESSETKPLPFTLPELTTEQKAMLKAGERVQEQAKMGREGSGFVVFDIPAPEYAIWEVLLDFEAYPENIDTVRNMRMFTNTHLKESYNFETPLPHDASGVRHYGKACISRAKFVLSKFRLNIAAVHRYQPHPDGHFMVFSLDKACQNAVLKDAKGIWYTETNPVGAAQKEGMTRVWLLCELKVSSLLPTFIVDYAARRAMPRATTWLPGVVERYMKEHAPPTKGTRK